MPQASTIILHLSVLAQSYVGFWRPHEGSVFNTLLRWPNTPIVTRSESKNTSQLYFPTEDLDH